MKLARRLESQLNRLIIVSASLGVVVLLLTTYISTVQIKNKAIGFITSNVKQISLAEINSQNVSEIDREVHRLYDAWKGTQDVDIRVEVYLDGKLVGKAGQLSRLGQLAYQTSERYDLPSGQKLVVNVDLDLADQILFDALLVAVFCTFIIACFVLLRRSLKKTIQDVSKPLEERVSWLTEAAKKLPESIQGDHSFHESSIEELRALDESLRIFSRQILALEDRVSKTSFNEGRVKMAELLAHSIKGTLSILRLRVANARDLNEVDRRRLISAVNEVANAAHELLQSRRPDYIKKGHTVGLVDVNIMLEDLIQQKRESLPADKQISLVLANEGNVRSVVNANAAELRAVFSNILDNSIEAIDSHGKIVAQLIQEKGKVGIKISDSGRGIAEDVMPRLMREGETFGKAGGNGLGLFHAKQVIDSLKGTIQLKSVIGFGTDVLICLPAAISSSENNGSIPISTNQTLVVLDDDNCIHESVKMLAKGLDPKNIVHLYSAEDFESWMAVHGSGELSEGVYWMDYDLKDEKLTGISLIKKYGLQMESYLVTGMAANEGVKTEAEEAGIRVLSKEDIPNIRFDFKSALEHQEMGLGARESL